MFRVSSYDVSAARAAFAAEHKPDCVPFDVASLEECYGIKPDDVGTATWARDEDMPVVEVEKLLALPIDLYHSTFKGRPPISFTFRTAVKLIMDYIESAKKHAERCVVLPLSTSDAIMADLMIALTNIDTARPDLVPEPPRYPYPVCSASQTDGQFWLGAILALLFEKGVITEYGRKGAQYWVKHC
jgi:hypothetical protein